MRQRTSTIAAALALAVFFGLAGALATVPNFFAQHVSLGFAAAWAMAVSVGFAGFSMGAADREPGVAVLSATARYAGLAALVLALLWGPLAYGLAGNIALNFRTETPFKLVIGLSFAILLCALFAVALRGFIYWLSGSQRHE